MLSVTRFIESAGGEKKADRPRSLDLNQWVDGWSSITFKSSLEHHLKRQKIRKTKEKLVKQTTKNGRRGGRGESFFCVYTCLSCHRKYVCACVLYKYISCVAIASTSRVSRKLVSRNKHLFFSIFCNLLTFFYNCYSSPCFEFLLSTSKRMFFLILIC